MKRLSLCVALVLLIGWLPQPPCIAADEPADSAAAADAGLWVTSIATIGDGSRVALASAQGLLLREASVLIAPTDALASPTVAYQQPSAVWAVVAAADGSFLASTDYRGNLAIHDLQSGETQHHEAAMERWTRALTLSPDGKQIIGGNEAGKLFVWNREQGAVEKTHELDPNAVMDLQFSPEGDLLAVADGAGHLHLLKWPSLEEAAAITVCDQPLWSVVFSGDGLIVGAANNAIYRCERSGGEAKEIAKMKDWVSGLAAGPTGLIAAAELGGRVQILTADGQPVGPAAEAPSGIWTLHWTNNGTLLVGTRKNGVQMMQQSWSWVEPKAAEAPPAEAPPAEAPPAEAPPAEAPPAEAPPAEAPPAEAPPAEAPPAEAPPAEAPPAEAPPAEAPPAEAPPAEAPPAEAPPAEAPPAEAPPAEAPPAEEKPAE